MEAVESCSGKTREDLDTDRILNLALTRLVEIFGEAANLMPENYRTNYPKIPWAQMIAARNRLIHGYDNVDFDILWSIVRYDLPELISHIDQILNKDI